MTKAADPRQDELALSSVLAHAVFPGRSTLYPAEVAKALSISIEQVNDLIVCGDLGAIRISATRSGPDGQPEPVDSLAMTPEERRRVPRSHWRPTVSGYDAFLRARSNQALSNPSQSGSDQPQTPTTR